MSRLLTTLAAALVLAGCAENPYRNAQGDPPPNDLSASCLRRAGFIILDQMIVDDCMTFHGYRKVAK